MRRLGRLLVAAAYVVMAAGVVAAAILPGPQHLICPSCHGLAVAAPNIYVDPRVPRREHAAIVAQINRARQRVAGFFGDLRASPRIVICRTRQCARTFGTIGAKGVAFAWHAIVLTPSRIFTVIAAHELAHIELHWRMGLWGWARGTVPSWFDEGLATIISRDPRFTRDAPASAVREVMTVRNYFGDWSGHARRVGWRMAYSAASTRVRQLERRIGRRGLKRFVERLVREGDLPGLLDKARRGAAF